MYYYSNASPVFKCNCLNFYFIPGADPGFPMGTNPKGAPTYYYFPCNVFTPVCQSFFSQEEGSLYDVTSCLAASSHVSSEGGLCLWLHVPSGGLCLWSHVPSRGVSLTETPPLDRDPSPGQRPLPWTETGMHFCFRIFFGQLHENEENWTERSSI